MMVLRLTNPVLSDMCYSLQKHVDRCVACPTGSKEFFIRHLKILNQSSEEESQIGQQYYVCKIIAQEPPCWGSPCAIHVSNSYFTGVKSGFAFI
jgi:hypothetical protein